MAPLGKYLGNSQICVKCWPFIDMIRPYTQRLHAHVSDGPYIYSGRPLLNTVVSVFGGFLFRVI
jgi:hypothetical protein